MYGMLCALLATGLWLLLATYWELPVSTTHSIVGAVIGMSMVAAGPESVIWWKAGKAGQFPIGDSVARIIMSWLVAPVLTGFLALALFLFTRHAVLRRTRSFQLSLWLFPFYGFLTSFILTIFIIKKGFKGINVTWQGEKTDIGSVSWGVACAIGGMFGAVAATFAATVGIWVVKKKVARDLEEEQKEIKEAERAAEVAIEAELADMEAAEREAAADVPGSSSGVTPASLRAVRKSKIWSNLTTSANTDIHEVTQTDARIAQIHASAEVFDSKTERVFTYLQICTACMNSLAHGSNDVANAVGPLAAIYGAWQCTCVDSKFDVPRWILVIGGAGIVLGLALYGYKIMRVMGVKMAKLTPSRGYCVELSAATIVIIGSAFGLPLSTTQAMVGAVTAIGMLEGARGFNYLLLLKFFLGWVATLVIAGGTAAAFTAQGLYSPNNSASLARAEYGAAINATNANIATALAGMGRAEQAAAIANQTAVWAENVITSLGPQLCSMQQGLVFLYPQNASIYEPLAQCAPVV
jgi:solute carrier family 20 (sodium-dependent phosphate transporter)